MNRVDKKNVDNIISLTPLQQGILSHYLEDAAGESFFEQLFLKLSGKIDKNTFAAAWNVVIDDNEMLRSFFQWEKVKEPVMVVLKKNELRPRYYDLSRVEDKEKELASVRENDKNERFDLRKTPFRITLCKLAEERFEMILSNNHILYDGWSNAVILKEFFDAYDALSRGVKPEKAAKPGFKEFVNLLRKQRQERVRSSQTLSYGRSPHIYEQKERAYLHGHKGAT